MRRIILASNRRVYITLSNSGQAAQESIREYPFNAADSLTLLKEERTRKTMDPAHDRKAKPRPTISDPSSQRHCRQCPTLPRSSRKSGGCNTAEIDFFKKLPDQ